MTPSSPLVRLLNAAKGEASGALGVIAGDIQGGNWLKRFGVFISDRFIYENRDNDLVVNTGSMFQGASRKAARYVFDQGSDVSHFNYFKNAAHADARGAVADGEERARRLTEFRELAEAKVEPVPLQRSAGARASTRRPIVVHGARRHGLGPLRRHRPRLAEPRRAVARRVRQAGRRCAAPIETRSVLGRALRSSCTTIWPTRTT